MTNTVKVFDKSVRIASKILLLPTTFFMYVSLKKKTMLSTNPFQTTSKVWKYIIKMIWKLFAYELFKYFRENRQNIYWSIIILEFSWTLTNILEYWRIWKIQGILMKRYLHWIEVLSVQQKSLYFLSKLWWGYQCLAQLY